MRTYYRHLDPLYQDHMFLSSKLFPENPLNISAYLFKNESDLSEAVLNGDLELLGDMVDDAVKAAAEFFEEQTEKVYDRIGEIALNYEDIFGEIINGVETIDSVIADVPEVTRESLTLHIQGKLARYKVTLWTGDTVATCRNGHGRYRHFCVDGQWDIERAGEGTGFSKWMKKPLQVALNLVNDVDIKDPLLLNRASRIAMCPYCIKDGSLSEEMVDLILQKRSEVIEDDELDDY